MHLIRQHQGGDPTLWCWAPRFTSGPTTDELGQCDCIPCLDARVDYHQLQASASRIRIIEVLGLVLA